MTSKQPQEYSLSPMQHGMLFHTVNEPTSGVYIQQKILRLHENLDSGALVEAWQRLVERHSILRTRFRLDNPQGPVQQVIPSVTTAIQQIDWRSLPIAEQQQQMETFLLRDRRRGFDFNAGPPMRLVLYRLADSEYELVWTSHHALLDGRSYVLILTELFQVYEALCNGLDLPRQTPHPYRQFVDWVFSHDWSDAEQYWWKTLQGITAPTPLVVYGGRPPDPDSETYRQQQLTLPTDTTTQLRSVAEANDFTVNNVLQGAWAMLLSRYSSEQDVVFGTTRAGRSALSEGRDRVGLFINTVPFRVNVDMEMWVNEFLAGLRRQQVALRKYEQTPLSMIQSWTDIPRPLPLFESVLIFENFDVNTALRSLGGKWERREFRLEERTNYPLTVAAYLDACLTLKIGYDARRFDDSTISRMLGHLQTLIDGTIRNLQAPLKDLPLLTERESNQLLVEWNDTATDFSKDSTLHSLFENQVDRTPDDVAVVFQGRKLTYQQLNQRANQLAHSLREVGVRHQIVGICMERSLELVVGMLGVLKAGGAYLPLDPSYPQDRLAFMLQDAQVPVLVTQERLLASLPRHQAQTVCLDSEGFLRDSKASNENPLPSTTSESLAYVMYTSGSTGRPKGVLISHRAICNHMHWLQATFPLSPADRVLQKTPMSFDASVDEFFAALLSGATLVVARPGGHRESAYLVRTLIEEKITYLVVVPSVLELLLEEPKFPDARSLKKVICGGEALSSEHVRRFLELHNAELINFYGPTETSVDATYHVCTGALESVPIGRPIANMQAYVLDANQQPVPIGVPGELYLAGIGLARGYLNRPHLTAEKFLPISFSNQAEDRMYRTGDRVFWQSDGVLDFIGRSDSQVKFRGFRIELGEIEALLHARAEVKQAALVIREDIQGDKRLVAYLSPQDGCALDVQQLRRHLRAHVPEYMVPAAYVTLKALPLTPNGKVDRRSLPAPRQADCAVVHEIVAPADEIESTLVEIWRDVLHTSSIGVHDNFFESGGDSLLAMRLTIQIKKRYGLDFSEFSIFQAPTVADLAKVIRRSKDPNTPSTSVIVPIRAEGDRPPFILAGLLAGRLVHNLAEHLSPDRPFYAILTKQLGENIHYGDTVRMASQLIEEIKSIQPVGPYFFGTFCNQGPVVLEMAQQLLTQGDRVGLLAMIEAAAPGKRTLSYRFRRLIYRDYHRVKTHYRNLTQLPINERLSYLHEMAVSFVKRYTKSLRRRQQRMAYYGYRWLGRPVPKMLRNSKAVSATLHQRYIPKAYPGRIAVFLGQMAQSFHDRTLGWSEFASGGIEVHVTPGNHTDMLREPNVAHLGRSLEQCLERAEAALADSQKPVGTVSDGSGQTGIQTAVSDSG